MGGKSRKSGGVSKALINKLVKNRKKCRGKTNSNSDAKKGGNLGILSGDSES